MAKNVISGIKICRRAGWRGKSRPEPDKAQITTMPARPGRGGGIALPNGPSGLPGRPVWQGYRGRFAAPPRPCANALCARRLHRRGHTVTNYDKISRLPHAPIHYNTGRPATLRRWHGGPCTSICRRSCYSGMLPCFFGGLLWFLLRHISRAHISLRRVSRGMMTSSMSPRSAVRYGLENSSS